MRFIINILKGILIGSGAILPGISSGVLCVIFGIYDILVDSIINFFKNWKKNLLFLFPIFLGAGIGILLFSNILKILFNTYLIQTKFAFIGLILGSLPTLLKKANSKGTKLKNLVFFLISFVISILFILLEKLNIISTTQNISFPLLVLAGFCMSAGVVIPGISSTIILMLFGVYDIYLNAISMLDFSILIPMGIGLVIGGLMFLKIIEICFKKFNSQTYYLIIGFAMGSIFILYENISFDVIGAISLVCFIFGFFVSSLFEK